MKKMIQKDLDVIHAGTSQTELLLIQYGLIATNAAFVGGLLYYFFPAQLIPAPADAVQKAFDEGKSHGMKPRNKIVYQQGATYMAGFAAGYASIDQ